MYVGVCVQRGLYTVNVVALRGQKRTSDLLDRPGVTDGYEPPHVGAGDRIWVLCESITHY